MEISTAKTLIISNDFTYVDIIHSDLIKIGLKESNILKANNIEKAMYMASKQLLAIIFWDMWTITDDTSSRAIDDIQKLTKKNETKIIAYSRNLKPGAAAEFVEQNELDGYITWPIYIDAVRQIVLKIFDADKV